METLMLAFNQVILVTKSSQSVHGKWCQITWRKGRNIALVGEFGWGCPHQPGILWRGLGMWRMTVRR